MQIQYCSDLHLEFPENQRFLARNPLKTLGDILILAGDVVTFRDQQNASGFFDFVCDHFAAIYWVPGNHEYYGSNITDKPDPLFEKIRDNLFLVNNCSVVHEGVRLIFTTLWSRISPQLELDIRRSVSDFSAIRFREENLTPRNFSLLHEESLRFMKTALSEGGENPTVVVTHHVPTLMNYPRVYKNSPLTEAFASEQFDLISDSGADCWIYGHHHINTPEFRIGKTRMVTNQLGYVHRYEYRSFDPGRFVEI